MKMKLLWSAYRVLVGVLFAVAFSADNIFMTGFWLFIFVTSYMAEEAGPNKEKKP